LAFTLQAYSQSNTGTLKTFEAPNAGTLAGTGTSPTGINALGTITGVVVDNNFGYHGFVLEGNAQPVSFDAPDADPLLGGTTPTAINDLGEITGYFVNSHCQLITDTMCWHGFLRKPNGKFTVFDAPVDASKIGSIFPLSINNFGVITGWYTGNYGNSDYGFYLTPNGKVTPLGEGDFAYSINDLGVIAGVHDSGLAPGQGFLIKKSTTTFQVPGTLTVGTGMSNAFVNDFGVVAGTYAAQQATDHAVAAGFLRAPNGTFTVFASPTGSLLDLEVDAVNIFATTTGWFEQDADTALDHAFVRYANGDLIVINMPVGEEESVGSAISSRGVVTGWWQDSAGLYHGYTWKNR
jgi:hypothetical protein